MYSIKQYFLLIIFLNIGCYSNKRVNNNDIDRFILQYNSVNFESIKGMFIFQRSRGIYEIIYGVGKFDDNKPLYIVEFNVLTNNISAINRKLLKKRNMEDYLTEKEITNVVRMIRKYDFFLLGVDSLENVYMNPFYVNEPAYFLRLKTTTGDSIVKNGYVYNLYSENWYINRTD